MSHFSEVQWNKQQLTDHLTYTTHLFQAPVFQQTHSITCQGLAIWTELIRAVSDLVRQSALAGKRIDFATRESGKPQDVTSLLDSLRGVAYVIPEKASPQVQVTLIYPALNFHYGVGKGYFANGHYFDCEHKYERAFFIGAQKIYFYRHLIRAFVEARRYLKSIFN